MVHIRANISSFLFFVFSILIKLADSLFPLFPVGNRGSKRRYDQLQPQLQRDITADYQRGVRGHGLRAIAKAYQLPIPTVQHVIARAERTDGNQSRRAGTKGESSTKAMRRSCTEHLTETLLPQTKIWRLLLATKFQNEVARNHASQQRLFKIRNLRNCQRSGRQG